MKNYILLLLKPFSNEGDIILDNSMGSGSAGVACKNTNRNFIGIGRKLFLISQRNELKTHKYKRIWQD